MSYRDALSFLNLKENYTLKELKNAYYNLTKNNHEIDTPNIKMAYDILSNELKKREFKELTQKWLTDINKLKDKYKDTSISELCISYEKKINELNNSKEINDLKTIFNTEISKLKNEITLPIEKRKIIEKINKYLDGYSLEIKKLASYYALLISNSATLEKLNTVKQKFDILIKEELILERDRKEKFKKLKDSFKRASIYRFIEYSKGNNVNNILYAHNELMLTLSILDLVKIDNMDNISKFLDNIKYQDIVNEYNELRKFYFKLVNIDEYQDEKINIDNTNKDKDELIDLVLDKYYLYATNKNTKIEKIIQNEKVFKDILVSISNCDTNKKETLFKFIEKEGYKDIKIVLETINDFKDPNKIYIERKTGEVCVINTNNKKIYSINLDGKVNNNIKSRQDIFWEYLSLSKFFKLATYSNGYEINEVDFETNTTLSDYYINYLYFTDKLLLCLSEKNNKYEFSFLPALSESKYQIGENLQITKNDYFKKYLDKDKCLNDLLMYINNRVYENKDNKNNKIAQTIQVNWELHS